MSALEPRAQPALFWPAHRAQFYGSDPFSAFNLLWRANLPQTCAAEPRQGIF